MANTADGMFKPTQELVFTKDERAELERARTMPITFDEDCTETAPERALRLRRVNPVQREAADY